MALTLFWHSSLNLKKNKIILFTLLFNIPKLIKSGVFFKNLKFEDLFSWHPQSLISPNYGFYDFGCFVHKNAFTKGCSGNNKIYKKKHGCTGMVWKIWVHNSKQIKDI